MSSPYYYLRAAHEAELAALHGREIASRLEAGGADLGSHLRRTRREFTSDVWDSAVARDRQIELGVHSRRLGFAEDDLYELMVELRAFADDREMDAAYFRQRYHAELLEELVEPGGPS